MERMRRGGFLWVVLFNTNEFLLICFRASAAEVCKGGAVLPAELAGAGLGGAWGDLLGQQ